MGQNLEGHLLISDQSVSHPSTGRNDVQELSLRGPETQQLIGANPAEPPPELRRPLLGRHNQARPLLDRRSRAQ